MIHGVRVVVSYLGIAAALRPQAILTYRPDGVSGHPDHIAIGRFAAEAFQRAVTIAALYTLAVPRILAATLGMTQIHTVADEAITHTVDVAGAWDAKMAAIRCHRTQLGESPILRATADKQRLFLGTEHFQRPRFRANPLTTQEQDIFSQLPACRSA